MLNREYDMTIFMNTHLLSELTKTCTNIGIIKQGKSLISGEELLFIARSNSGVQKLKKELMML